MITLDTSKFAGTVQAGFPSPAADYMEDIISLDKACIKHPSATFFFRVQGESMTRAHILPGALLVVDRSIKPRNGSIVIAVVDGEHTVKRLVIKGKERLLLPDSDNPKYKPVIVGELTQCEIWGVVTYTLIDTTSV